MPLGCTGQDTQGTTLIPAQRKFQDPIYDVGLTHKIVRPASLVNQPENTILTSEQVIFLQEFVDHDIFPYMLLAIVILLFISTTCRKNACVSDFVKKLGCFVPICKNRRSNRKDARPFELEELMGGKEYATILKSPKVSRNSHLEGTPKPVATPRVSFQLHRAPTEDSIQIPVNSKGDLPSEEADIKTIKLHMKKFKDLKGYKYKWKLCETVLHSYGDLKSHIEEKHVSA